MISELSVKERDLLHRVDEKEGLRPLFFRKVKGLKWFNPLAERGYFSPDANIKPVPTKEDGYVNIPFWPVVDYLVKTAPELADKKNQKYSEKFLQILLNTTIYAKKNEFSNYHIWWQFAEVIQQIPHNSIPIENLDIVDYWLDDKYESDFVAQVIGEKWLPRLLQVNDAHALQLSTKIIELLYKVIFVERKYGEKGKQEASLRFDYYQAQKITKLIPRLAGEKLGLEATDFLNRNPLTYRSNWDKSINSLSQFIVKHPDLDTDMPLEEFLLLKKFNDIGRESTLYDILDNWVEEYREASITQMENLRGMVKLLPKKKQKIPKTK